ncbi:MAG: biotin--[acetyl-CoA-carboxylase] ligase [Clostridium sp.]|nr:biotin--[acetyl-CoA-carboxylase] ligase [Prevotella sp.]MCM1429105.1 biotin--[acetyl-CoA-carboxylase] ligase [Clostridium sp.]MCM1475366.1 biotin--[acetyl-CoA-carboxylase] ligase [Muribaculaceae bacterium]
MKFKVFDSLDSTNTYLRENNSDEEELTMIIARDQTAGRGQRGNSWESEPHKNLTFSFIYHPEGVHPRDQFAISEAVALAIVRVLRNLDIPAMVKWPNDIYVGDRKICGILIEHSVTVGKIMYTIAGAGLNVNQRVFHSDAPNPVSMTNLTGIEYNLEEVAKALGESFDRYLPRTTTPRGRDNLHAEFMKNLWRGDGSMYPFQIASTDENVMACIIDVLPSGIIRLIHEGDLIPHEYAFKEISFLLQ